MSTLIIPVQVIPSRLAINKFSKAYTLLKAFGLIWDAVTEAGKVVSNEIKKHAQIQLVKQADNAGGQTGTSPGN